MISVIIPVYNGEKYIENMIRNLRVMEFGPEEIIFVNDGSQDETRRIVENEMKYDGRIKLVNQENKGVSAARNAGLSRANGDYICFLDVDDTIDYNYFRIFMESIRKNNVDVAFCDLTYNEKKIESSQVDSVVYYREEALEKFLYRKFQVGVCGMIISKKLFDENDLKFKEGFKYSEDLHMVWRVINSTEKIVHIQAPLYVYNQNQGSAMTKIDESKLDGIKLMMDLEEYFEENNPTFYPLFKKYGVARNAWAILWQAVRYLNFNDFLNFTKLFDFKKEFRKLLVFPDVRVVLSSICFIASKRMYYFIVSWVVRNYRA